MSTQDKELDLFNYTTLFIQKGVVLLDKIKNQVDLTEEDEVYLRVIHDRLFFSGDYEIKVPQMILPDEIAVQQGLFTDKSIVNDPHDDLGTAIDPYERKQ